MPTDAAYRASSDSPLVVDEDLYRRFGDATRPRILVDRLIVPIRSGRAWVVPAGSVCRISTPEGPQVGDLNIWNLHNPRERFWASRTRQLHAAHVSLFDRLWSTLPYLRPLATVVGDTLADYGRDDEGGRVHDLLGTRCDPYVNQMLSGEAFDYHCHSNLTRAVAPFHLNETDVHDVLNVFQCTGLNDDDQYFMKACPAKPGDYFELFAEIDLLMALSTCPGGDLSIPLWGPDAGDPLNVCRPLEVEVFKLPESDLSGWQQSTPATYSGRHGVVETPWSAFHSV